MFEGWLYSTGDKRKDGARTTYRGKNGKCWRFVRLAYKNGKCIFHDFSKSKTVDLLGFRGQFSIFKKEGRFLKKFYDRMDKKPKIMIYYLVFEGQFDETVHVIPKRGAESIDLDRLRNWQKVWLVKSKEQLKHGQYAEHNRTDVNGDNMDF